MSVNPTAQSHDKIELVTIATFSYPTEAYIPHTKLESEGVWSFVADADTVTMNWLYSNAIGGVKLQVRGDDVERALEILNRKPEMIPTDDIEDAEEAETVTCPTCQSTNTRFETYETRLVFLSWLLLNFPLPFFKRRWTCRDCGHIWKAPRETV